MVGWFSSVDVLFGYLAVFLSNNQRSVKQIAAWTHWDLCFWVGVSYPIYGSRSVGPISVIFGSQPNPLLPGPTDPLRYLSKSHLTQVPTVCYKRVNYDRSEWAGFTETQLRLKLLGYNQCNIIILAFVSWLQSKTIVLGPSGFGHWVKILIPKPVFWIQFSLVLGTTQSNLRP